MLEDWFEALTHLPAYGQHEMRGALALLLAVGLLLTWLGDLAIGLVESRVALTAQQRSWLSLAAPYFVINEFREGDLRGLRPLGRRRVRRFLREDWGISDGGSAVAGLEDLWRYGHRSDPSYHRAGASPAERAAADRGLLAWDAMRLVFVARCCFAVGFIDATTAWAYVGAGRQLAQASFTSWAEWGQAFLDGRTIWGGPGIELYRQVVGRLLADPKSAWGRHPWAAATSV